MTERLARLIAALFVAFGGLPTLHASAFCRLTTEGDCDGAGGPTEIGNFLEWDEACISYAIDIRGSQWLMTSEVEEAIDLSFETWENVDCGGGNPPNIVFKPLQSSTCRRIESNCSGNVNTIAFLDPWADTCEQRTFESTIFAATNIWHNDGVIFGADMVINDQLMSPGTAGGPYANCPDDGCPPGNGGPSEADLRTIVTHEVGHILGLGHSEVVESTMFRFSDDRDSVDKRELHPDDIDAICTVYPPGDLDQSCDATPLGGLELDCEQRECTGNRCIPGSGGGGGCSASGDRDDAPLAGILVALVALIVLQRRPARRAARS